MKTNSNMNQDDALLFKVQITHQKSGQKLTNTNQSGQDSKMNKDLREAVQNDFAGKVSELEKRMDSDVKKKEPLVEGSITPIVVNN